MSYVEKYKDLLHRARYSYGEAMTSELRIALVELLAVIADAVESLAADSCNEVQP